METARAEKPQPLPFCFEPTYEEWKRKNMDQAPDKKPGFEPTYEEWKRRPLQEFGHEVLSFEPTYEEWKRRPLQEFGHEVLVSSLPMRNGNYSSLG